VSVLPDVSLLPELHHAEAHVLSESRM
jgi:hypothetical protein